MCMKNILFQVLMTGVVILFECHKQKIVTAESLNSTHFHIEEQRSTSILIRWTQEAKLVYMVKSTASNQNVESCEGGIVAQNSFFRFTNITDTGVEFQPRTNYNLALCTFDEEMIHYSIANHVYPTGPAAPVQVNFSDIQTDSMKVTWSDPDKNDFQVARYEITLKKSCDGERVDERRVNAGEGNYVVIDDLEANRNYTVSIVSLTNDGRVFSDESVPTTKPTAPGNVSNMIVWYDFPSLRFLVLWNKPTGGEAIDKYWVKWKLSEASEESKTSRVISHSSSNETYCYITSTVESNAEYEVTIVTTNEVGESETVQKVETNRNGETVQNNSVDSNCIRYAASTPGKISTSTTTMTTTLSANSNNTVSTEANVNTDTSSKSQSLEETTTATATTITSLPQSKQTMTTAKIPGPPQPSFNVSATLTSITVTWLPMQETVDYLAIESEPLGDFNTVIINSTTASWYDIFDVTPYTKYTIVMYSVMNYSGENRRSTATYKNTTTFAEVFCSESSIPHANDEELSVTFPLTQAGYTNQSKDLCPPETSSGGKPLGSRSCSLDGTWLDPVWMSLCNVSLHVLAETNITTEEMRYQVASDLAILTSNSSELTEEQIALALTTIEVILSVDDLQQNTSSMVVESVGNLLGVSSVILKANDTSKRLRFYLDEVASKLLLGIDEEYDTISPEIALTVVDQTSGNRPANTAQSLGYLQRQNPNTKTLGFSSSQFETATNLAFTENSSFIVLPGSVLTQARDGRISFYAFLDDTIFLSLDYESLDVNTISIDAKVQSDIILSAAVVGKTIQNLTENVSIVFQISQCAAINVEDCAKQYCGYWDESTSYWSEAGCTMVYQNDKTMECQCNHLTNFASLFAYGDSSAIRSNSALDTITLVGCSISLAAVFLTMVTLIVAWNSGKLSIQKRTLFLMINLSLSLFLLYGFVLLSFLDVVASDDAFCTAVAVILHFSLFSSLSWMMAEAVYVYIGTAKPLYFRSELTDYKVWLISSLWGWGFPLIFIALSAGISISSYQSPSEDMSNTCWIIPDMMVYLVIIPAAIILSVNVVIYIIVIKTFFTRKFQKKSKSVVSGKNLAFSFTLFLVFGITWTFGFLMFTSSSEVAEVFAYIFTITTSLQGLFLFFLFVVRNQEIRVSVSHEVHGFHSKVFDSVRLTNNSTTTSRISVKQPSNTSLNSASGKWCSVKKTPLR